MAISIHTLCEEGDDLLRSVYQQKHHVFQSTPSVKRVTQQPHQRDKTFLFQSTPSVKRVTFISRKSIGDFYISIHTLCEEGDRRAYLKERGFTISIHTLCEEGDETLIVWFARKLLFQSTPSVKRVTALLVQGLRVHHLFQSTPSVKRVTETYLYSDTYNKISIHTLCEEGDQNTWPNCF